MCILVMHFGTTRIFELEGAGVLLCVQRPSRLSTAAEDVHYRCEAQFSGLGFREIPWDRSHFFLLKQLGHDQILKTRLTEPSALDPTAKLGALASRLANFRAFVGFGLLWKIRAARSS